MLTYPAIIEPDGAGFMVRFVDIPEALTQGDSLEEAKTMAEDALVAAMDFYFEDRRPVPMPSPVAPGQSAIELPISVSAKVLLLNQMIQQQVTPATLARRLHTSPQSVNRLVDLHHATKIDTLAEAMRALGHRLVLQVA